MEHFGEKMVENQEADGAEPQNKGFGHHHRHETEGCNRCVSTSSELPESSSHASHDKFEASSRGVMSLANAETHIGNSYGASDGELVSKGFTLENFEIPNSALVSNSNHDESMNRDQKCDQKHFYQLAKASNEGGVLFNSGEDKERKLLGHKELMPLLTQKNKGIDQVAAVGTDNCNKPVSSYRQSLGDNQLQVLSSSSFAKVLGKYYLQGKGVESKHLEAHDKFSSTTKKPTKTQLPFLSGKPSDPVEAPKAGEGQPLQKDTNWAGSISSHSKINLREWLGSGVSEIEKVERLQLFRQIVQFVDIAHSEGIALLDLRPSNFIFEFPNRIKYTGSFSASSESVSLLSQVVTKKRPLQQDMQSQNSSVVKQQNLGKDVTTTADQAKFLSECGMIRADTGNMNTDDYAKCTALHYPRNESTSNLTGSCLDPDIVQLEKKWYACPVELFGRDLLSSNIYSLGVLLFEVFSYLFILFKFNE